MTARPAPADQLAARIYEALYDDAEARVCKDIPEDACRHQPRNFVFSAIALALTKSGDRLVDPKLTLAWLISGLGAPGYLIGLIAPVREAGSLLPQLFIARWIRERERRKFVWAGGAIGQALALFAMALAALALEGEAAGWALIGLLALFALARAFCSVSHKDVLGKTVSKTRRGAVSGYASSLSGLAALGFGALLIAAPETEPSVIALILAAGGVLWVIAALAYLQLAEAPGATQGGANAIPEAFAQLALLRTDPAFARFVLARAFFMATSLLPPFFVAYAQSLTGTDLAGLGAFLIASSAAGFASGWAWGRSADTSARWVLAVAGVTAALACALVAGAGLADAALADSIWFHAVALFLLAFAHQGVRLGRATYVVDLATQETRAAYTAVSNTVIGVLLLVFGALAGAAFGAFGPLAIAGLGIICLIAAALALSLKPVSG
ncbi:MFS transporter [Alkalicaulis satelles]|uniref:MFS transporter n=1 Tax=Alkalicaulis satelles TaxID=2609175 RepID=A0A5M6ZID0_9PROT|nr:MFS transporter [Alkalicaulis satelles]KAA5804592.1 MFS transporter [Alkalicaulis satelles]